MTAGSSTTLAPRAPTRLPAALEPLRAPRFRPFMIAMLFFTAAIQLEMVAQGWLVYQIEKSNVALGIVTSMWSVTLFICSPLAGALTDRLNRKRLVIFTWSMNASIFVIVTLLIFTGRIEVWHLVVAALLNGVLFSFNIPARIALISQLVGDTRLMGAMALVSMAFNFSGIVHPLIGGLLIDLVGAHGAYLLIVCLYLGAISATAFLRVPKIAASGTRGNVLTDLAAGLRFVWRERTVMWLLFLAWIVVVLGMSYPVLLPGFAAQVLNVPASGLGLLFAATGLGALVGNYFVASRAMKPGMGRRMFVLGTMAGVGLIWLGLSRNLYMALGGLFLVGMSAFPFSTINQSLVQLLAPPNLRGRVQSLYMLTWASMPLGTMPLAAIADRVGMTAPLLVAGVLIVTIMGLVVWTQRRLLNLPPESSETATARSESAVVP